MVLSETWFIDGYIDFELQKYRLLAYLNEVNKYFTQNMLYPPLSDVIFHYNNLHSFRDNKQFLQDRFPKQLTQVDVKQLSLVYERMLQDDELMRELEQITNYALETMKGTIKTGAELYEIIEQQLRIEPVGILPLYKDEGYILLRYGSLAEIRAYAYTITFFEHKDARYRGVKMNYVDTWQKSIVNTYEQVKRDIVRNIRTLPTPAVYSIESPMVLPLDETLLPIAKRLLVRHIATA